MFEAANVTLQSEFSLIHKLESILLEVLKSLLLRFVKPSVMIMMSVQSSM